MRKQFSKIALVAIFGFALTFTFSCSSGSDDNGGGTSSPSGGGDSSGSNSGGGSCNISSDKSKKMPDGKTWMTENLNCKVAGSECYDKKESYCNTYGRLYTWEAAKEACSGGWHLPSDAEWEALVTAVGGEEAGKHLKSKEGWNSCGPTGSGKDYLCEDTYGFFALPGGYGSSGRNFRVGDRGYWWSSTESGSTITFLSMDYQDEYVNRNDGDKGELLSVRCVKD